MSEWAPKRFWKTATIRATNGGYTVLLDERPVKTPAKTLLEVPSEALAAEIAAEFDAQDEHLDPATMPFTRTANSALDKVSLQRAEVADLLADYGDSDLLCYRADAPDDLIARQADAWDPLLAWAADTLGARLEPRTGVMHVAQDADSLQKLRDQVHAFDPFSLAAFHDLVAISGSLIIGFAAVHRHKPATELWDLSRVDENYQNEQWGADEEEQIVVSLKRAAFLHADRFVQLCAPTT